MKLRPENIPDPLRLLKQWIVWKTVTRGGKPTKVPYQVNGQEAKSNDPKTWATFEAAWARYEAGGYDGPGFVFSHYDPFVGIDLDGCRNPETGEVAEWAKEVILKAKTYAEVSPSQTGVKLWVKGQSPFEAGKKRELPDVQSVSDKTPGIEVYSFGRYFAMTGWRLSGQPAEPQEAELHWLRERFWPPDRPPQAFGGTVNTTVVDRARRYMATMPPAVSGQGGHNHAFRVACVLACGFGLSEADTLALLREYNHRCEPPWSEKELAHKAREAAKQPGERNYLRDKTPDEWKRVRVPKYTEGTPETSVRRTTLNDAAERYIRHLVDGRCGLLSTGLPEVDYALGGGVAAGEVVIFAGRPSHGKSAVALQCVHSLTAEGLPAVLLSEEMSALALGKRVIQFAVDTPEEHWKTSSAEVRRQLGYHFAGRAECRVVESCQTAIRAAEEIRKARDEIKAQLAVVDYAQLLRAGGKSEYEEVSNTSRTLRAVTNETGILLLMLCQMSRAIEGRPKFVPQMSDLRASGQLEQDADVILFLCWPHRLDDTRDAKEYRVFVAKNRNRPIHTSVVKCEFDPVRQAVLGGGKRFVDNWQAEDEVQEQWWNK